MQRLFTPLAIVVAAMFAYAPVMIAGAPYESTMGFVQKIFYFHFPSAMSMFASALICGIASAWYLFGRRPKADHLAVAAAELTVVFGVIVLVSGPLWARKAWGVWWQWDARLTSTLIMWLIFVAYLLLRRYGGPGSERLAAGVALFGMVNVPFVYWSVNVWRTVHPLTSVVPTLPPALREPLWFCTIAFLGLLSLLLSLRTKLEARRSELDALYLSAEERA